MPPAPELRTVRAEVPAALLWPGDLPVIPPGHLDPYQKADLLTDTGAALMACRAQLVEISGLVTAK